MTKSFDLKGNLEVSVEESGSECYLRRCNKGRQRLDFA
jgi:hypothetical protein